MSIGGFGLVAAAGFAVDPGASTSDVAAAVADGNARLALTGLFMDTVGSLFFIVFAVCLWSSLRRAEGQTEWISFAALAAALLMIAAGLGDKAAYYAIFSRADTGLDAGVATALYDTAAGFFTLFSALGGFFLLMSGIGALRTRVFCRWLGWSGIVVGLKASSRQRSRRASWARSSSRCSPSGSWQRASRFPASARGVRTRPTSPHGPRG